MYQTSLCQIGLSVFLGLKQGIGASRRAGHPQKPLAFVVMI